MMLTALLCAVSVVVCATAQPIDQAYIALSGIRATFLQNSAGVELALNATSKGGIAGPRKRAKTLFASALTDTSTTHWCVAEVVTLQLPARLVEVTDDGREVPGRSINTLSGILPTITSGV